MPDSTKKLCAVISITSLEHGSTIRLLLASPSESSSEVQLTTHEEVIDPNDGSDAVRKVILRLLEFLPQSTELKIALSYPMGFAEAERRKVLDCIDEDIQESVGEYDSEAAYCLSLRPMEDRGWQNDLFLEINPDLVVARISTSEVEWNIRTVIKVAEGTISSDQTQVDTEQILTRLVDSVLSRLEASPSEAGSSVRNVVVIASSPTIAPGVVKALRSKLPGVSVHRILQAELAPIVAKAILERLQDQVAVDPNDSNICIFNVAILRIGIAKADGFVRTLIPRNYTLPNRRSCIFTTSSDNQTSATVRVVGGLRPRVDTNRVIAEVVLKDIPPRPRGVPRIQVTLDIKQMGETEVIVELIPEDYGAPAPRAVVQLQDITGDMNRKEIMLFLKQSVVESDGEIQDPEAEEAEIRWVGKEAQGELPQ